MIMRQNIVVLITSLLLALPLCGNATDYVSSPNGNVRVGFSLTADGTPTYTMSYKGKPVVRQSIRPGIGQRQARKQRDGGDRPNGWL